MPSCSSSAGLLQVKYVKGWGKLKKPLGKGRGGSGARRRWDGDGEGQEHHDRHRPDSLRGSRLLADLTSRCAAAGQACQGLGQAQGQGRGGGRACRRRDRDGEGQEHPDRHRLDSLTGSRLLARLTSWCAAAGQVCQGLGQAQGQGRGESRARRRRHRDGEGQ